VFLTRTALCWACLARQGGKEKALLHTFVRQQKYGVGRDATRRFFLAKKQQGQQVNHLLP